MDGARSVAGKLASVSQTVSLATGRTIRIALTAGKYRIRKEEYYGWTLYGPRYKWPIAVNCTFEFIVSVVLPEALRREVIIAKQGYYR